MLYNPHSSCLHHSKSFTKQTESEGTEFAQRKARELREEEEDLKQEFLVYFNEIDKNAKNVFIRDGIILYLLLGDIFVLQDMLRNHYESVVSKYQYDVNLPDSYLDNIDRRQLDLVNQFDIETRVKTNSQYIHSTNKKDLRESYLLSILLISELLEESGGTFQLSNQRHRQAVAENASEMFTRRTNARVETIATTETFGPAGKAQAQTAKAIAEAGNPLRKKWNTILDGRERPWHHQANGQTQPIDSPFIVNGEQLNEPRDQSLGASANNIIDCRCWTTYHPLSEE